jgi:hypothetical protein
MCRQATSHPLLKVMLLLEATHAASRKAAGGEKEGWGSVRTCSCITSRRAMPPPATMKLVACPSRFAPSFPPQAHDVAEAEAQSARAATTSAHREQSERDSDVRIEQPCQAQRGNHAHEPLQREAAAEHHPHLREHWYLHLPTPSAQRQPALSQRDLRVYTSSACALGVAPRKRARRGAAGG